MEQTFLRYVPGTSLWHTHDPRLKLGELVLWCGFALAGPMLTLMSTGLILFIIHCVVGTRLKQLVKPLRFWLFLSTLTIFFSSLSQPEPSLVIFGISTPMGITGLKAGTSRAARLLVVLMASQILAASTDPADVAHSIRILTFFLPKSWSGTIAAAITLTLTFIPQLLTEASSVKDALVSRGLQSRPSIFLRLYLFGMSLTWRTIQMIDMVAEAMLSRRFITDPTTSPLKITRRDWFLVMCTTVPPAIIWIFYLLSLKA